MDMGDKTTITVSDDTLERFKAAKADLDDVQDGAPDHSADSFMQALLDTWDAVDEHGYGETFPDGDGTPVYQAGSDEPVGTVPTNTTNDSTLEGIQSSVKTIEERTGKIERTLEDLQR